MYPKIIFMDLEGTLLKKEVRLDNGKVAPSAWTVLAEALGETCYIEEEKTKDKWLAGGYPSYLEWMKDTIKLHKAYGLTRSQFYKVIDAVEYMPGAEEAVRQFVNRGAITAIISGGFKPLCDRVQTLLKVDHAFSGCEYFFDKETGLIEHFNLMPSDEEGKVDFMNLIIKEYGVSPSECVFVGDGKNDIALAKAAGFSIAFNAQIELERECNVVIKQPSGEEDFRAVAEAINKRMPSYDL